MSGNASAMVVSTRGKITPLSTSSGKKPAFGDLDENQDYFSYEEYSSEVKAEPKGDDMSKIATEAATAVHELDRAITSMCSKFKSYVELKAREGNLTLPNRKHKCQLGLTYLLSPKDSNSMLPQDQDVYYSETTTFHTFFNTNNTWIIREKWNSVQKKGATENGILDWNVFTPHVDQRLTLTKLKTNRGRK